MEFVTIHELAKLSGVSTATIRLDIKAGKIPIATMGSRGRGNPTRIRISDLERTDRIQYQQLARKKLSNLETENGNVEPVRFTVNELALRTGLSAQVIRKDILDGKLHAEGGGRRGSPYMIFHEHLLQAARPEYRRVAAHGAREAATLPEEWQSQIVKLQQEIQQLKERISFLEQRIRTTEQPDTEPSLQKNSLPIVEVPLHEISLPAVFENYYISEEKIKELKHKIEKGVVIEPVHIRKMENGSYLLRRGIAQFHVAQELGLVTLPAHLEIMDE
ncbi:ParB N-terminal domain-containing protein [Effusibacillus dendaii]|uniref:ParB-like N-terminal domain-containing protein n=1 Tax=Effusibacillus dendaii TaxID=2743772 RepID=A0A7I8DES7_9BACL|nr:hypothetical protein [Effusibacillus dendaii]BCJ86411.1 hypothetical protein skT53_13960 [Effusibacillus dendaii]